MNREQQKAYWAKQHALARKNWSNWSVAQKKEHFLKTHNPTNETHHTVYKGKDLGKLKVYVGGDGNGNGLYRNVFLPDGNHMNLDVQVRPEFENCWRCKKRYNAHKSNGLCPHCGIDV